MLSDEWLRFGYTHSDNIDIIDGLIDYYIWTDTCGSPIGISVNFEYADDVHYELHYSDWVRFLKDCLHTTLEDCSKALYTYFSKSDSHMFRNLLTDNKISFDRVVFYDSEILQPTFKETKYYD